MTKQTAAILDGLERGEEDIFPDPFAVRVGAAYASSPKTLERDLAGSATAA